MLKNRNGLQLDERIGLQKLGWKLQTIVKTVLLLLLLAGALGLFGNGILSDGRSVRGQVHVSFERFVRNGVIQQLDIQKNGGGIRLLRFPAELAGSMTIEKISPQPAGYEIRSGATLYRFGEGVSFIRMQVSAEKTGKRHLTFRADDILFELPQFIYP